MHPADAVGVATILNVLTNYSCAFAVRAGGTSPWAGASNIAGGTVIDLERLSGINIVNDKETPAVVIGAGNRFGDVYRALDPYNLSVAGTRNGSPGVSGSVLGGKQPLPLHHYYLQSWAKLGQGGISFFSQHRGWSCDDVLSFEIVLANGTVVTASESSDRDLYWALRGGGNNFGIVTQMTMATFAKAPSYYSFKQWEWTDRQSIFHALEKDTASMPDGISMIATTIAWHPPSQKWVISERAIADAETRSTSTHQQMPKAERKSGMWRSTFAMAEKMDRMNPDGYFNLFGSMTVHNKADVFLEIANVFRETMQTAVDKDDIEIYTVFNPLTSPAISKMQQRGGNALGITQDIGPLVGK